MNKKEQSPASDKSGSKWIPWKKIKELKKEQLVVFLLFGVLLLVAAIPAEPKEKWKDMEEREEEPILSAQKAESMIWADSYEGRQEERLKEILQKVEGVGQVEVMITLQASAEQVVEKDIPTVSQKVEESDSAGGQRITLEESSTEETVYHEEEGARVPYVIKQIEPRVEGVIVIAQGGGNAAVKQQILEAVQALFPVEAHKIKIMKMEDSK